MDTTVATGFVEVFSGAGAAVFGYGVAVEPCAWNQVLESGLAWFGKPKVTKAFVVAREAPVDASA